MFRAFILVCSMLACSSILWGQGSASVTKRLQQKLDNSVPAQQFEISILLSDRIDIGRLDRQFYANGVSLSDRTRMVIHALKEKAAITQVSILAFLESKDGVLQHTIQSFWVTNVVFCTANAEIINQLAQRDDVEALDLNVELLLDEYETVSGGGAAKTIGGHEPGHDAIKAPAIWAMGYSGYGRKVMSLDTGVDPYHPAISDHFDGYYHNLGEAWMVLGRPPEMPTDCNGHGTHTVGTMCGLEVQTSDTIGVAWGARWIGSPSLCGGGSSTDRNVAGFQWAMDPDGDSATIEDMPDVINNSWYDPNTVGQCTGMYKSLFSAVEAVGIAIVFSAGNSGSGTSTITEPKNINTDLVNVFCVANLNGNTPTFPISTSSSRGPSTCGGTGSLLIKPEVAAPGSSVRSCTEGGYDTKSGTSMAAPHVSGAIALLKEGFPYLTGSEIKLALYFSCVDLGLAGEDNTYGMGLIDVPAAYNYLIAQGNIPVAPPENDAAIINVLGIDSYNCYSAADLTLVLENRGTLPLQSASLLYAFDQGDTMSLQWTGNLQPLDTVHLSLASASLSQGTHEFSAHVTQPNGVQDERTFNDKIRRMLEIAEFASVGSGHVCESGSTVLNATNLNAAGVQWFAQPSASPAIGSGASYTTPVLSSNSMFYSDVRKTSLIGKFDSTGSGGWTSNDSRYLVFDCFSTFTLVSVKVFSDEAGTKRIDLRDDQGAILDSVTVTIPLGESRVILNFNVVPGSDLRLGITGQVDLFRNSSQVLYPYTLPGVMSIKSSDQGPKYYYYFFDWEVAYWSPCGRTPVPVYINPPIIASVSYSPLSYDLMNDQQVIFQDNTIGAESWSWDFDDGILSSQQNPTHEFKDFARIYNVALTVADSGSACTDNLTIAYEVYTSTENIVFPNPSSGRFSLDLGLEQGEEIVVSIYGLDGKMLLDGWKAMAHSTFLDVDISALADGAYIIVIDLDDSQITQKLVKASE